MASSSFEQSPCEQGPSVIANENEISIVLIGKTGAGKTSLAKSLLKVQVKDVPTPKQVSTACEEHVVIRNGVSLKFVDTVGLVGSEKDMRATIIDIATCTNCTVDVLIYCLPVGPGARFADGNPLMMKCLQNAFGKHIWKHCLLAFTFSNGQLDNLKSDYENDIAIAHYRRFIHDFASEFQEELRRLGVDDVLVRTIFDDHVRGNDIPTIVAVPAGKRFDDAVLSGIHTQNKWVSVLLEEVENSCRDERKAAFKKYRASMTWSKIMMAGAAVLGVGGAVAVNVVAPPHVRTIATVASGLVVTLYYGWIKK